MFLELGMEDIVDRKCWLGKHIGFRSRRWLVLGRHIDLNYSPMFLGLGMEDIEDRKCWLGRHIGFRSNWSLVVVSKGIGC